VTEAEWLACEDPQAMLGHLGSGVSARKGKLFDVAGGRRVWDLFPNATCRKGVETAERFADGLATWGEITKGCVLLKRQAYARGLEHTGQRARWVAYHVAKGEPFSAVVSNDVIETLGHAATRGTKTHVRKQERARQCGVLRDIFGNPFHPIAFSQEWRTDTAIALARQMYDSRDFSTMPILADALQDAGCDNADILDHCRGSGPHVRGCWVVDLVLGKE